VFLPGDVDKWDLHMLHFSAWEKGVKSLYYLRSKSVQRAGFANREEPTGEKIEMTTEKTDYEECLACQ
jgi:ribonucleoside-diphosphate reductase alpha chain